MSDTDTPVRQNITTTFISDPPPPPSARISTCCFASKSLPVLVTITRGVACSHGFQRSFSRGARVTGKRNLPARKYETRTKYGIPKFYTTEELKSNIKEFMALEKPPTGISAALTNLKALGFISKESKAASESRTKFIEKKGYRLILKSYKNYIKEY